MQTMKYFHSYFEILLYKGIIIMYYVNKGGIMTNDAIAKEIADKLIEISEKEDKEYFSLFKELFYEYNIDDERMTKVLSLTVHEISVRGYLITSTEPLKMVKC